MVAGLQLKLPSTVPKCTAILNLPVMHRRMQHPKMPLGHTSIILTWRTRTCVCVRLLLTFCFSAFQHVCWILLFYAKCVRSMIAVIVLQNCFCPIFPVNVVFKIILFSAYTNHRGFACVLFKLWQTTVREVKGRIVTGSHAWAGYWHQLVDERHGNHLPR